MTHYFGKHHIKEIKKWYSKKYGKDFHIPFEPKPLIKVRRVTIFFYLVVGHDSFYKSNHKPVKCESHMSPFC